MPSAPRRHRLREASRRYPYEQITFRLTGTQRRREHPRRLGLVARSLMRIHRWGTLAATAIGAFLLAALPIERAHGIAVAPLALPGPYAVECSNVLQDFSRIGPG